MLVGESEAGAAGQMHSDHMHQDLSAPDAHAATSARPVEHATDAPADANAARASHVTGVQQQGQTPSQPLPQSSPLQQQQKQQQEQRKQQQQKQQQTEQQQQQCIIHSAPAPSSMQPNQQEGQQPSEQQMQHQPQQSQPSTPGGCGPSGTNMLCTNNIGQPLEFLESLLQRLMALDREGFFRFPVDEVLNKAPNYYAVIKQPMCFQDMLERITDGRCRSFRAFRDDFELICNNARKFNSTKTRVHKSASILQKNGGRILKQAELDIRKAFTLLYPDASVAPSIRSAPSIGSMGAGQGPAMHAHGGVGVQALGSVSQLGQLELTGEQGADAGPSGSSAPGHGEEAQANARSPRPDAAHTPRVGRKVRTAPPAPRRICPYISDNEDAGLEESARKHAVPLDDLLSHIKAPVSYQQHSHSLWKRPKASAAPAVAASAAATSASSDEGHRACSSNRQQLRMEAYWLELRMAELKSLQQQLETRLSMCSQSQGVQAPSKPSKPSQPEPQNAQTAPVDHQQQQQQQQPSASTSTAANWEQQSGWSTSHSAAAQRFRELQKHERNLFFFRRIDITRSLKQDTPPATPSARVTATEPTSSSQPIATATGPVPSPRPTATAAQGTAPPSADLRGHSSGSGSGAGTSALTPKPSDPSHSNQAEAEGAASFLQTFISKNECLEARLRDKMLPGSVFGALEQLEQQLIDLRGQLQSVYPQRQRSSRKAAAYDSLMNDLLGGSDNGRSHNLSVMTKRKRSDADPMTDLLSPGQTPRPSAIFIPPVRDLPPAELIARQVAATLWNQEFKTYGESALAVLPQEVSAVLEGLEAEGSSSEDTGDEAYEKLHEVMAEEERKNFEAVSAADGQRKKNKVKGGGGQGGAGGVKIPRGHSGPGSSNNLNRLGSTQAAALSPEARMLGDSYLSSTPFSVPSSGGATPDTRPSPGHAPAEDVVMVDGPQTAWSGGAGGRGRSAGRGRVARTSSGVPSSPHAARTSSTAIKAHPPPAPVAPVSPIGPATAPNSRATPPASSPSSAQPSLPTTSPGAPSPRPHPNGPTNPHVAPVGYQEQGQGQGALDNIQGTESVGISPRPAPGPASILPTDPRLDSHVSAGVSVPGQGPSQGKMPAAVGAVAQSSNTPIASNGASSGK